MSKRKGLALWAFAVAIASWVLWLIPRVQGNGDWLWVFPIPGPLAVVLAALAYRKQLRHPDIYGGEAYYIAAMVLGIIASAFLVALIIGGPPDNT